jgi:hypothetical protein
MTEIKARVPMVEAPDDRSLGSGDKAPKYSWRDDISFDGDYTGEGDPIIWFLVGEGVNGDQFAADLAIDPDVKILGQTDR